MKKLAAWQIGLLALLFIVVVGTIGIYYYLNSSMDPEQSKVENETEEAEQVLANGSLLPVDEAKTLSIYTTTLHNAGSEAEVYLVPIDTELEAIGTAGDREYFGTFAFYMAKPGDAQAVRQEQLVMEEETLRINDDLTQFYEYQIGETTLLGLIQGRTALKKSLTLWMYDGHEMKDSLFDGNSKLSVSDESIKIIGVEFLQAYAYDNGGGDNGAGWIFTTWEWKGPETGFTKFHEVAHTDNEPYGWEVGEYHANSWRDKPYYYVPFPQFTFTDQSKQILTEGKFIHEHVHIDMPIEDVLKNYPNYTGTDYYEGGPYYAYPGGISYFYNELTDNVNFIVYAGDSLTNTIDDFFAYYGEPQASGYDELTEENYHIFKIGNYRLLFDMKENGDISSVWLSEW